MAILLKTNLLACTKTLVFQVYFRSILYLVFRFFFVLFCFVLFFGLLILLLVQNHTFSFFTKMSSFI